jgi:trigger factor
MNVEVENLPNCVASLRIELPPDRVTKEWNEVVQSFKQVARIPGFRQGKAPPSVVEAKFRKEIENELKRKLVSETTNEAIREKGLKVLSVSEVEDVEFTPERTMRFTATLITAPEFELPEYKGIPLRVPSTEVSDEEVQRALENLRESRATFSDVEDKALDLGDFAVIDYTTFIDNQPLAEAFPKVSKMLASGQDFWIKLDENTFLKGFSNELIGMRPAEMREFDLSVAEDYPIKELAGKTLHFKVTLKTIKRMQLPEVNDDFANQVRTGFTLEQLRAVVKDDMISEKKQRVEMLKRDQVVHYLALRVECELPQSLVKDETRRIMSQIVQENQMRGVTEDVLRENEKNIVSAASRNAKERLKGNFILVKIAEKENIQVSDADVKNHIRQLANRHRTTFEKMKGELEERRAMDQVHGEVLTGKVLDFLTSNANIEIDSETAQSSA